MRRIIVLQAAILMMTTLAVSSQGAQMPAGYSRSDKLPAGFMPLVPKGYVLDNQQCVKYAPMASISFAARKEFSGRHSLTSSEFHLDLNLKEVPGILIQRQAPMYKKQMEADVESRINNSQEESSPTIHYEKAKLTTYPWGSGITQRVAHKYMGAGTNPDEIEYRCSYFGLITDDHTIKQFKLTVSGLPTAEAADAWAKQVAEKVTKTTLANITD